MDSLDLIERTIVALQAGKPLPQDVAQEWERGLRQYRDTPNTCFEKAMGFKARQGKRSVGFEYARQQQLTILKRHYREYHAGVRSKHDTSCVIAEAFQAIEANDQVRVSYAILYSQLAALPLPVPGRTHLYRLLRRLS